MFVVEKPCLGYIEKVFLEEIDEAELEGEGDVTSFKNSCSWKLSKGNLDFAL